MVYLPTFAFLVALLILPSFSLPIPDRDLAHYTEGSKTRLKAHVALYPGIQDGKELLGFMDDSTLHPSEHVAEVEEKAKKVNLDGALEAVRRRKAEVQLYTPAIAAVGFASHGTTQPPRIQLPKLINQPLQPPPPPPHVLPSFEDLQKSLTPEHIPQRVLPSFGELEGSLALRILPSQASHVVKPAHESHQLPSIHTLSTFLAPPPPQLLPPPPGPYHQHHSQQPGPWFIGSHHAPLTSTERPGTWRGGQGGGQGPIGNPSGGQMGRGGATR